MILCPHRVISSEGEIKLRNLYIDIALERIKSIRDISDIEQLKNSLFDAFPPNRIIEILETIKELKNTPVANSIIGPCWLSELPKTHIRKRLHVIGANGVNGLITDYDPLATDSDYGHGEITITWNNGRVSKKPQGALNYVLVITQPSQPVTD